MMKNHKIGHQRPHLKTLSNPWRQGLFFALLFLAPLAGWGQDFSGIWYIASNGQSTSPTNYSYNLATPQNNYYLRPAADPIQTNNIDAYWYPVNHPEQNDSAKPFLTTNKTNHSDIAVWQVVKTGEYYFIIHVETGKYVKCEPCIAGTLGDNNDSRRKTMHLEACSGTPTDDAFKFKINYINSSDLDICIVAKIAENSGSGTTKYWNVAGKNQPYNSGQGNSPYYGGLIGLINSNTDPGSKWRFEHAINPVITFDYLTNKVSIDNPLTSSYNDIHFYYTTDGNTPTSSSTEYTTPFEPTGACTVKAIAVRGAQTSDVISLALSQVATPTVSIDAATYEVTISGDGDIYYYTTDGTDPIIGTNEYTGPFALDYTDSGKTIKAIAVKADMIHSAVGSAAATFQCKAPVISFNNTTQKVVITCEDNEANIFYTTNGDDPTTGSTAYTAPFPLNAATTVKAKAFHAPNYTDSEITSMVLSQVETPVLTVTSNRIYLTCATPGATIYYTTDGITPPDPTISSQLYSNEPLSCSGATIQAVAVKAGMLNSEIFSGSETLACDPPVITRTDVTHFSITAAFPSPDATVTLYYTTGSGNPGTEYPGTPVAFSGTVTVKAQATATGFDPSTIVETSFNSNGLPGGGTSANPYIINDDFSFSYFLENASNSYYQLTNNVNAPSSMSSIATFSGTLEAAIDPQTKMPYRIKNLSVPIFTTLTGTVKNLVIENVSISQDGKVGSVACTASGSARIYNVGILGGSVKSTSDEVSNSSTGCCGGLVGFLDGEARVVNCYNYADIKGGNRVGGIVGYNNVETKSNNLKTMVFGCMFYGNITGGADKAPIYNGKKISNKDKSNGVTGVSNFNYFRLEAPYVQPTGVTYNCALGAEDRFLQRFEFFRLLLNGYRKLAGWWATGTYSSSEMHKWVMIPDSIGTSHPYPVLKEFGKYPSVVNYDAENAITGKPRNQGGKLGVLTVNIQMGNGAVYNAPTGASIKTNSSSLTLNITDKDTTHFNFNYYKVQLPYYNDVGTKNYTGYRVVTGWKIVKINGSETGTGTYVAGDDVYYDANNNLVTPYNFADRNCTNKDLYSVSGRIFNQGAYWDVPEGVTSITIEPYWAKCAYLADPNADKVYNTGMGTGYDVPNVGGGEQYTDGESYTIAGESQVVYTTRDNAITSSGTGMALFQGVNTTGHTVYDYAVVLVGNYHLYGDPNADNSKPYTLTSVDLDGDNEPDYSYIWRFDNRRGVHPVRVDFINIPGLGMVQKSTGGTGSYNFGILQPKGFFETTNTSLFRVTQLEYDAGRDVTLPIIVQGGVMEQWVGGQGAHKNKITYFHVGGNVWFKEFHRGTHQDQTWQTKHPPVSVTGGDYDEFYLTGLYRGDITNYYDNAECYINGGRFGIVCGAAMEGIGKANGANNTGNITWQIQNADIREFYAGGLNAAEEHTVTGNLSTTITGGYIGVYCGGPKFGDMSSGKTIITNATDCTFGTFFGAGYGGNSYSRYAPANRNNVINLPGPGKVNNVQLDLNSWNDWVAEEYTQNYNDTYRGVSTQFNYQFLPMSNNTENVARLFVEYVKFSLATTHGVTSTLTGCTIIGNFYGGGNLGKVDGQVTSVLESCTAKGNVYGAGQASTLPTVEVDSIGFRVEPLYYTDLGTYRIGVKGQTTIYTWEQGSSISIDTDNHILYTTENLAKTILGSVSQKVTLTIKGNSTVLGSVFGGGDESVVHNNTEVQILENTIVRGNIYGGGNMGEVRGNTRVIVNGDEQQ